MNRPAPSSDEALCRLQAAIDRGFASGVNNRTIEDIIARRRSKSNLPK